MLLAMAHHVIYVPGLGDSRSYGQDIAINLWRLYGLKPHYFALGWADKEPFEPKLVRLLDKAKALRKQGHKVSLVGVSAGASAVLNAYSKDKEITGAVCICGKINNPQTIGRRIYELNPAFEQSMAILKASLENLSDTKRRRLLTIYAKQDSVVPPSDSKISGAHEIQMPISGHIPGIFYAVVFKGPAIARFLRKQARV